MLKGKHLPHKYAVLLDSVEAEASYCCVKAFVRDTALQQPPVYLSPAGRHTSVLTSQPRELIAKKEMSEDEIKSYLKLANLCKTKYEMPDAHDALRKFVRERHYEAARYAWLARPQDATYGVVHTMQHTAANVHFPYLPDRTWEMCARVSWSTCLGFWCIWCVWSDWGYWEKRCCSRPGSSMQMLFVFSSALLVALPQHACRYWWLLRGAPINCKELL